MKRIFIFILSIMFCSILCSLQSCLEENVQSQCNSHTMESKYNYLSCFKGESEGGESACGPFFSDKNAQKQFFSYEKGYQKELSSIYPFSSIQKDESLTVPEKDSYDKAEIIKYKEISFLDSLTDEDKKIMNNNNTCLYQSHARFVDPDNYIGEIKINISNKDICYNVDRFEDLKDIVDCGYATTKIKYNNSIFVINNCFLNIDSNINKDFKPFFEDIYFPQACQTFKEIIPEMIEEMTRYPQLADLSRKNELEEEYEFEASIEDRNGNIMVFNQDCQIIDEPTKFLTSSRNNYFNIISFLCIILLFV